MIDSAPDARAFRQALGSFLTGVTVVTTPNRDGAPWGCTADSWTRIMNHL